MLIRNLFMATYMEKFNWLGFCIPCRNWCCYNEAPFASNAELDALRIKRIRTRTDGSCVFLDDSFKCSIYSHRPFECRIFPFDIKEINGKLHWIVWQVCPAAIHLDYEKFIRFYEANLPAKWTLRYIMQYVDYHKSNEPKKYSEKQFTVIRELLL
jgi:Fe-S-cluster containining protein